MAVEVDGKKVTKGKLDAVAKVDAIVKAKESNRLLLVEMDRKARFTRWLEGDQPAGPSAYGDEITNEQWCVCLAGELVRKGTWATVKRCGPLVAVFVEVLEKRFARSQIQEADFVLVSDVVRKEAENEKKVAQGVSALLRWYADVRD